MFTILEGGNRLKYQIVSEFNVISIVSGQDEVQV